MSFRVFDWLINSMSRVLSASWSPYKGFRIEASRVGVDVPSGYVSSMFGNKIISETYDLSSSSSMVIKSKRMFDTPISPDVI
jgi:hypothetical protein